MRKPKLAAEIAKQLRRFHQVEIPGSKEPQLWNDMMKFFEKGFLLIGVDYFYLILDTIIISPMHMNFLMVMLSTLQPPILNLMIVRSRGYTTLFLLRRFTMKSLSSR